MPTFFHGKPVFVSIHAVKRGQQIGMDVDMISFLFTQAHKMSEEERKKHGIAHRPAARVYINGTTKFFVRNYPEKLIIVTIWDDLIVRDERIKYAGVAATSKTRGSTEES